MSRKSGEPSHQTAFRIPVSLLERVDRQMARMNEGGLGVSRTKVVTYLLTRALDELEGATARCIVSFRSESPGLARGTGTVRPLPAEPETRSAAGR